MSTACPTLFVLPVPQNFRSACELKRSSLLKIRDHQARPRIDGEVAQRVEHAIAGVIGNAETRGADNFDEAGLAAPMRSVNSVRRMLTGNEKRVGRAEPFPLVFG